MLSFLRRIVLGVFVITGLSASLASAEDPSPPKLYVGLFRENAVAVVDTATNRVIKKIAVPAEPEGMAISPDDGAVYVSCTKASRVVKIDTATDAVAGAIEVGTSPQGLALSRDGETLMVANFGSNSLSFVDTSRFVVTSTLKISSPHSIAVSPDGKIAIVASQDQETPGLVFVDPASRKIIFRRATEKKPRALAVSPDGEKLYVTAVGLDAVEVYPATSGKRLTLITTGGAPHLPLFTGDADTALVVGRSSGLLYFVDPDSDTVDGSVKVGDLPYWIAANEVTAWVSNENSNTVSVVDLYGRSVTANIEVGGGPRQLVVQRREH